MKGHGDSAPIGVAIQAVRSGLTVERKTIPDERRDDLAGTKTAKARVVQAHRSDYDRDLRLGQDLDLIGRL